MVFILSVLASVFWNSFKRLKISYRASALKIFVRHKKFRNWEISYLLGKNNQILLAVHIFKIDWKLMMLIMKESFYHPCGNNNCQANSEEDWSTCDGKVGYSWNLFTLSLHIYQESFPAYTRKVSLHIQRKFPCIYEEKAKRNNYETFHLLSSRSLTGGCQQESQACSSWKKQF